MTSLTVLNTDKRFSVSSTTKGKAILQTMPLAFQFVWTLLLSLHLSPIQTKFHNTAESIEAKSHALCQARISFLDVPLINK